MKLVLVTGMSGSGKTTVAKIIHGVCSDVGPAALISTDDYYKSLDVLSASQMEEKNFDCPLMIDFELLESHVRDAKNGRSFYRPCYSFHTHTRTDEVELIPPLEYLIIEGIFSFHSEAIRNESFSRIFVETNPDICLARRKERDVKERGRNEASVLEQWNKTVLPMAKKHLFPMKDHATKIIVN